MNPISCNRAALAAAVLAACATASFCGAAPATQPSGAASAADVSTLRQQNDRLQHRLDSMQQQLDALQRRGSAQHTATPPAAAQPSAYAGDALSAFFLDQRPLQISPDVTAGYKDGFYLADGDAFRLIATGLFDIRYTYANAKNDTTLTTTPLGTRHDEDVSGFSFNTAQLALSGELFHNVIFKAMGDFGYAGGSFMSPYSGNFQVNELWVGYRVAPELNFRVGSLITPIVPLRSTANNGGLLFPDIADTVSSFGPNYSIGADVYGSTTDKRATYDLELSNGGNSQDYIDATAPNDGQDNRLAVYTREQLAGGGGNTDDFRIVSDLKYHPDLAWCLGFGFGYDSQNSTSTAFPGAETGVGFNGISHPVGEQGFGTYTLDGNVYRFDADVRTKWRGWSIFGEALYQSIESEGAAISGGKHSLGQVGYFIESGYFLLPKKFEIVGRFGQLYTDGLPHEMDQYAAGLNYYLAGENARLELAETYIPRQSGLTDGNGAFINTRDWITEAQFQVKF